jgi:hypothetical protein
MDEVLPLGGRRRAWKRLGKSLGLHLPPLEWPTTVHRVVWSVALVLGWAGILSIVGQWRLNQTISALADARVWVASIAVAFFFGLLGYWLTTPASLAWPRDVRTVGDMARAIVAKNCGLLVKQQRPWNRDDIWIAFQAIVCKNLGVDQNAVTREARFVEDLGAG